MYSVHAGLCSNSASCTWTCATMIILLKKNFSQSCMCNLQSDSHTIWAPWKFVSKNIHEVKYFNLICVDGGHACNSLIEVLIQGVGSIWPLVSGFGFPSLRILSGIKSVQEFKMYSTVSYAKCKQ